MNLLFAALCLTAMEAVLSSADDIAGTSTAPDGEVSNKVATPHVRDLQGTNSLWDCYERATHSYLITVEILWGHTASDGEWACNNWIPGCANECYATVATPLTKVADSACNGNGGPCECGTGGDGTRMTMNSFWGDWNDEQVYGCTSAFHLDGASWGAQYEGQTPLVDDAGVTFLASESYDGWEGCCYICGMNLQMADKISPGWYCHEDALATGIWLKGVNKDSSVTGRHYHNKPTSKPVDKPYYDKPPTSKPVDQPYYKPPTSKPVDKPTTKPPVTAEKPTEKPYHSWTGYPTMKPVEAEKPTEKPYHSWTNYPTMKPVEAEKPTEKPYHSWTGYPTMKPVEAEKPTEKPYHSWTGYPTIKPVEAEKPTAKPYPSWTGIETDKPTSKPVVGEKPTSSSGYVPDYPIYGGEGGGKGGKKGGKKEGKGGGKGGERVGSPTATTDNATDDTAMDDAFVADMVGGGPVPQGQGYYRWFAVATQDGLCGATLIHSDMLLTAAHCEEAFQAESKVMIGSTRLNEENRESDAEYRYVISTKKHPFYHKSSSGIVYDFMLVHMDAPVNTFAPIRLNDDTSVPADDEWDIVIGFGDTPDGGSASHELYHVDVQITPHDVCQNQYLSEDMDIENSIMICAGVSGDGSESCPGDSGGPLIRLVGSEYVQDGVVSFGESCGGASHSGVYARVSAEYSWIREQTCAMTSVKPDYCAS